MRQMLGIATAVAAFACVDAAAANMTKEEYISAKTRIAADYQAARQKCGSGTANATDICIAHARGAQKAARAELDAAYQPSPRAYYKAAVARADAEYAVAKQRCDYEKDRGTHAACEKDAQATRERAKAEARLSTSTPR
jgi:hypothetical protein